jgi:hypothetical protein
LLDHFIHLRRNAAGAALLLLQFFPIPTHAEFLIMPWFFLSSAWPVADALDGHLSAASVIGFHLLAGREYALTAAAPVVL